MPVVKIEMCPDIDEGHAAIMERLGHWGINLRCTGSDEFAARPPDKSLVSIQRQFCSGTFGQPGLAQSFDKLVHIWPVVTEQLAVPIPITFLDCHRVVGGGQRQCIVFVDSLLEAISPVEVAENRDQYQVVVRGGRSLCQDALNGFRLIGAVAQPRAIVVSLRNNHDDLAEGQRTAPHRRTAYYPGEKRQLGASAIGVRPPSRSGST